MKDLTQGDTRKVMLAFTLPMFGSVIFQQMYNITDTLIVGKFGGGKNAVAAVGASYPVTMIFLAIAMGANVGASVVISQLFGHKDYRRMKTCIYTALISAGTVAVLLTIAGHFGCRRLITLLNTPKEIRVDSDLYLRIYIWGLLFLFLYNICNGIFTALGDSRTPFYFLVGSSVGNILLDMYMVIVLKMGVAGVAWATFIAQGVASVLALSTLLFRIVKMNIKGRYQMFSFRMLGRISYIAVPSILQQSFVSVGNLFIQALVNGFGPDVMAGYSVAIKLNTFAITSFGTLSNAVSSFVAQNIGARKINRVAEGWRCCVRMGMYITAVFFFLYFVLGKWMIGLFMDGNEPKVIHEGMIFLRIISPFYITVCVKIVSDGVLRGGAAVKAFMVTTFADLIIRVGMAYILTPFFGSLGIWLSWPVGWVLGGALSLYLYKHAKWEEAKI